MENGRIINVIVVEDEPIAVDILKRYTEDTPGMEILRVFEDAVTAMDWLTRNTCDAIFLDIHLPGISGVQMAKSIPANTPVIFTTAFPQYAVDGFELNALDYLLKPFSFERFLKAVLRLKQTLGAVESSGQKKIISLKSNKKTYPVDPNTIEWIEACGDYMKVILPNEKLMVNSTLKDMLGLLPNCFLRVHRSFVVNMNAVQYQEGNIIHIQDKNIPIGEAYRNSVEEWLK